MVFEVLVIFPSVLKVQETRIQFLIKKRVRLNQRLSSINKFVVVMPNFVEFYLLDFKFNQEIS